MNVVENSIFKTAKAFWVCFLIVLAGLIMTANVSTVFPGTATVPNELGVADETDKLTSLEATSATRASRGINEDANDYVDLYRDVSGDPQILIDGASPGVNDIYIGEPNVRLDIPIESLKPENANDNDGDDILYNVSVSVLDTSTKCWDSETCSWIDASEYITWDVDKISPTYKEDSSNEGNALLIDGVGSKYIPWFYNDYNDAGFLDHDNDQRADNSEFYRIWDDYKMFEGFTFDVAGNAPTGTYNISVEITYKYQTYQNVSTQRLSGGGGGYYDPDTAGPSGTGDLGLFEYYFWEPYEINGGTVNFNVPNNIKFRKRANYMENNVEPTGASWEAIPDLGYNNDNPNDYDSQGGTWDYQSNYDNDGVTSWNDGSAGTLNTVVSNWNSWGFNDYAVAGQSYIYREVDQYPYNLYDGNGTWQYSGYEGDTVWTEVKTEVEFIEIHVEHGVSFSEPAGDGCELVPDPTTPYYLKAGDDFKKMYMQINNRDNHHSMEDIYVNITLDDTEHFSLKRDWAWKDQISSGGIESFYYRMDALNGTPVDRYTGTITITYTREGVRVTEDLPMEYILYFTPDLINSKSTPKTELEVSKVIHTGQDMTEVEFTISNYGNTLLENGVLTMDFSNFKNNGEEYTDPEGGEGTYTKILELPYLEYYSETNNIDISVDVEIPNHWSLNPGVYKLLMDYDGYYFNDGVLGEPTNYVKVWMDWYDDDNDDNTDMNAYCVIDTDGDENMDIFTDDETRPVDGVYMYVQVEEFVPQTPELKIVDVSINGGTDTFEQGSIDDAQLKLTMANTGEANITDLFVELDLQGYFKGKQYYDGYTWNIENPKDYNTMLNIGDTAEATLEIEGIDKLLPPGTHRLKLKYTYSYDNGSTPSELSTDSYWLYFNITVTDNSPDLIPTVSDSTGVIRLGNKLVDIDLYIDLSNREYYELTDISAELTVGDDTPFIPGTNATLTGKSNVLNKWANPAMNSINSQQQNLDNMYFNLNLHPDAEAGTYYLDLTLRMYNERTMTRLSVPTTLEVKIYPKIAKLRITQVVVSTGSVTPGKEFNIDVTIQNDGGESAREIYLEFEESYISGDALIDTYESINPTGAKYPFSSDVMKAYIAEIQPHSTGVATFTVIGDLNIYPGVTYFQNIEMYFKDSTGYDHTTTDVIPIQSDSTTKTEVDGVKYVWDTDRNAWISESELAAEEVTDYMPWIIGMIIAIWLVTFLIAFMYVIRPKYKREKENQNNQEINYNTKSYLKKHKTKDTEELEMNDSEEPVHDHEQDHEHDDEDTTDDENIIDYRTNQDSNTDGNTETESPTQAQIQAQTRAPSSPWPRPPNPPPGGPIPKPTPRQANGEHTPMAQVTTDSDEYKTPPVSLSPPAPIVKKMPPKTQQNENTNDEHMETDMDSKEYDWDAEN